MNKISTRHIKRKTGWLRPLRSIAMTAALLLVTSAAMAQRTDTPAGVNVKGSVFGGGKEGRVGGSCAVTINQAQARIETDVYGGGDLAKVNTPDDANPTENKSTTVNLGSGVVVGSIYGGGHGEQPEDENPGTEADVFGPVTVIIDGGKVDGSVFGCNNLYGTPKSTVTVTVNGTAATNTVEGNKDYAIEGVYGGGNQAHYVPTTITKGYPRVTINGCNSSIANVYGGGKAAGVSQTNVIINGGDIGRAFAGGDGDNSNDTPAHVGYKTTEAPAEHYLYATPTEENGIGDANIQVKGGTIVQVFGGSNKNGVILDDVNIDIDKSNEEGACAMHIAEVYGGGNMAPSKPATTYNVGCTGSSTEGITYLYGGAYQAPVTGNIVLNITDGHIDHVFGGNNVSGTITGDITVNINKKSDACSWHIGNVYGGGNLADYSGSPQVNITNGLVTNNVYGGGLGTTATVTGTTVNVNGGTVGQDVFGGGSEAAVSGATHVTVTTGSVGRDVYGGGALANTGATTVDIMGGTITRDVYGGGLGDGSHAPKENGEVIVNIGAVAGPTSGSSALTEHSGSATIGGNVYGCNNSTGSPQDDVTVNIYGTAHTEGVNTINDNGYAIANVFGGGNAADYAPENGSQSTTKKATVHVYGCKNTIERTFGGGNAAATSSVITDIQGGRINKVFGGGNGELGPTYAANVNGTVNLNIHGGNIGEFYGGSNQNGTISGQITTVVDNDGPCPSLTITEFFCGGNFVDITNDLTTTIDCSDSQITYLYGGCNQANITGNVTLNLCGGTYDYVFGGSKGRLAYPNDNHPEYTDPTHPTAKSADITGNVTLNLYGGTILNVFGGSNVLGNITGTITVNVLDEENTTCPLYITNIYGGSNLTNYQPTNPSLVSPIVNVVHAKYDILGNVYGGSKGEEEITTMVKANPRVNIGYESGMTGLPATSAYNPASYSRKTTIHGSVFGGGDAAKVEGNTEIHINKHAKVIGNVYGGGNMGEVDGNTKVIINGKRE